MAVKLDNLERAETSSNQIRQRSKILNRKTFKFGHSSSDVISRGPEPAERQNEETVLFRGRFINSKSPHYLREYLHSEVTVAVLCLNYAFIPQM